MISLAASAERWARARTSEATTAKPRPASPARAASTPAFSARRLVWKAISSITPMIWLICWAEFSISLIAATASRTTTPERSASARAEPTASRAWPAPSAVLRTVAVISSSAAAVSSRLAACCSVRRDRLSDAWLISVEAGAHAGAVGGHLDDGPLQLFHGRVEVGAQLLVGGREGLGRGGRSELAGRQPLQALGQAVDHLGLLLRGRRALGFGGLALRLPPRGAARRLRPPGAPSRWPRP